MKRLALLTSIVFSLAFVALPCSAEIVKRRDLNAAEKEKTKVSDVKEIGKIKQNKPKISKEKPRAKGKPRMEPDPWEKSIRVK